MFHLNTMAQQECLGKVQSTVNNTAKQNSHVVLILLFTGETLKFDIHECLYYWHSKLLKNLLQDWCCDFSLKAWLMPKNKEQ